MNTDQRVKHQIGDLVVQICVLQGQVEALQAQIAALTPAPETPEPPKE